MKLPNTEIEMAVARGDIRKYVNHAHLDVEKGRMVATDGKILAVVPVETDENDTTGPITLDAIKAARKGPLKQQATIIANDSLRVPMVGLSMDRPTDIGTFPDIDRPLNAARDGRLGPSICFDHELLYDLGRALTAKGAKYRGVRVYLPACAGGLSLVEPSGVGTDGPVGVLMPMHDGAIERDYDAMVTKLKRADRMLAALERCHETLKDAEAHVGEGLQDGVRHALLAVEDLLRECDKLAE